MIGNLFAISLLEGAVQIVTSFQMHQKPARCAKASPVAGLSFWSFIQPSFFFWKMFFS